MDFWEIRENITFLNSWKNELPVRAAKYPTNSADVDCIQKEDADADASA